MKKGRLPHKVSIIVCRSGWTKACPRKRTAGHGSRRVPGDLTQRIRDGLFRRHRVADGGGFHPAGLVYISGIQSYGFEYVVKQDTRFAVEQLPVNRILDRWAKADDGKLGDARSGGNGAMPSERPGRGVSVSGAGLRVGTAAVSNAFIVSSRA